MIEQACNLLNELSEVDYLALAAMTNTSWDARTPHHAVEYTQLGPEALRFNVIGILNGIYGPTGMRIAVKVIEGRTVFVPEKCDPNNYKELVNAVTADPQDH